VGITERINFTTIIKNIRLKKYYFKKMFENESRKCRADLSLCMQ
jgi:hypothetical protein